MFRPVPMQRLSVVVLERDERAVLRGLGRLGAVHLLRTLAGPDTAPLEPPDRTNELRRCDDLLGRMTNLARRLSLERLPEPSAELPEIALDEAHERLAVLETRGGDLLARQQRLQGRWGQITALLEQVSAYEGIELPVDRLGQLSFLHFAVGSLPVEHIEALQRQVGENVVLLPMPPREGKTRLVAVTSRKGRFALETALEQAGFLRDTLVTGSGQPVEGLADQARREQARVTAELAEARDALAAVSAEAARPLADLQYLVHVERQILEAEQQFPRTDATALLTGWVPAADVPAVRRHLQDLTAGRCVVETEDPDRVPEYDIPVLLRHSRWLRPFEMLVAGYGLPAYRELEPTLFAAVTFLLMFGMMFGDVGHGAVLVLAGLGAVLWGRSVKTRDVGLLLAFGGASSILFGLVYGEYFGLSGWGLWHNPLEGDIMEAMRNAVIVGIVILSLGLVLNVVNRFRRGDIVGGLLDKFGVVGAVFYWGVLALGVKFLVFHQRDLHWLEIALLVVLPLVALTLREPILYALTRRTAAGHHGAANLLEAFFESAVEAFEAVLSYMANTISFVRLAAYAMSHAAILTATFLMAREVSRMMEDWGAVGGATSLVIIVLGNILTILLEGIIAVAQAIRLEYYEFFGKFFSGSGRAFEPFRLTPKGQ